MPTLPTLTINDQTVWNRLLAAFNNDPVQYKAWLKKALRDELERREVATIRATRDAESLARADELKGYLDGAE